MSRRRLIVLGIVGQSPYAGVAWQALHYVEGFRRLGHDVVYVEDTGYWPYDAERETVTDDCRFTVGYIERLMRGCGLGDRWAYRAASEGGRVFGLSGPRLAGVLAGADAVVNVTGTTVLGEEHRRIPVRIYVETDPVLPQIQVAHGQKAIVELLEAHTHHFTFGENVGTPRCALPVGRFAYRPTRQPVVLDWWRAPDRAPAAAPVAAARRYTTVASWRQTYKDVEWEGRPCRWSKHAQFERVIDLPRRSGGTLELALAGADAAALARLRSHGWRVVDAVPLSRDIAPYRGYILGSDAEFTVAKEQYVVSGSGWFSDRSACYLAAGKPVITEDTGFPAVIPTGRGVFAFRAVEDALAAMEAIAADYAGQAAAARAIAHEYFDAERVLARLLAESGL